METTTEKFLVWFSGTGTPIQDMTPLMSNVNLPDTNKNIISGLGTTGNSQASQPMTSSSWLNPKSYTIFQQFANKYYTLMGYSEENQLASIMGAVTNTLEKITTSQSQSIELIIGGHSRGAAAGILGFLSSFVAAIQADSSFSTSPLFNKVKKIHVVPVDPVPGPNGNDLMGFSTIQDLYGQLKTAFNNQNLIDTTLYSARFDCRDGFKFDNNWFLFLNGKYDFNGAKSTDPLFKFYAAGLRHSIMIYPQDGGLQSSLYTDANVTPIKLLENILNDIINGTTTAPALFNQLIALEKATIARIKVNPTAPPNILQATSMSGYSTPEWIASTLHISGGTSLKDVVAQQTNLVNHVPINNRYTFYYFNQ